MKNWKFQIAAVLTLCVSTAQAELSYKWVKMNAEQTRVFRSRCYELDQNRAIRDLIVTGGASAVGYAGFVTAQKTLTAGVTVGGSALAIAALAAVDLFNYAMTGDEIKALVLEQQSGNAGLMTEELEQIATENNQDVNRMLAILNIKAVSKELCVDITASKFLVKNMDPGQRLVLEQKIAAEKGVSEQVQQILNQIKN